MVQYIRMQAARLFPAYFAMVMATGALSIAAFLLGWEWVAESLMVCNLFFYSWLAMLTVIRIIYFFPQLVEELASHHKGPGFFTLVAGTCVLGSQWYMIYGYNKGLFYLWWLALILWFLIMYGFFFAVTIRKNKPGLAEGINGAWLIASVATQSVSILAVLISVEMVRGEVYAFISLCMYLLGCMLYLNIIALIFYRFTFIDLKYEALTPPYWINMGAVAITALSGSTLILHAEDLQLLEKFLPFLYGFTLFFWMAGTWWIPLLFLLMLWKHLTNRQPLRYEPQIWGMAFPIAMYTTSTYQLAEAMNLPFLKVIPESMIYVSLLTWGLIFIGFLRKVFRAAPD